jgi:hypothetical protein
MDLQGNKSRTTIRETVNADTASLADASGADGRKYRKNKAFSIRPLPRTAGVRPSCPAASRNRAKDGPRSTLQVVFLSPLIGLKSRGGFGSVGDGVKSPATCLGGLGRRRRPRGRLLLFPVGIELLEERNQVVGLLLAPTGEHSLDPTSGEIEQIKRRALSRAEQLSNIYLDEADSADDQSSMELAQKLAAQSITRLAGLRDIASASTPP